jgi:hypothetical protein
MKNQTVNLVNLYSDLTAQATSFAKSLNKTCVILFWESQNDISFCSVASMLRVDVEGYAKILASVDPDGTVFETKWMNDLRNSTQWSDALLAAIAPEEVTA